MLRFCKTLATFSILGALVWLICPAPELRHPPGVRTDAEPAQSDCAPRFLNQFRDYTITAVASYELSARVLHTKRYWADQADLVPYDVALGWGPMSDQAVLDGLEVSQGNRFFFYQWRNEPPIPLPEIVRHAANNHVIAANAEVARAVKALRAGQIAQLQGWLVDADGPDGFHWPTSRRRDDSGNGACELFYVESVAAVDRVEPDARALLTDRR